MDSNFSTKEIQLLKNLRDEQGMSKEQAFEEFQKRRKSLVVPQQDDDAGFNLGVRIPSSEDIAGAIGMEDFKVDPGYQQDEWDMARFAGSTFANVPASTWDLSTGLINAVINPEDSYEAIKQMPEAVSKFIKDQTGKSLEEISRDSVNFLNQNPDIAIGGSAPGAAKAIGKKAAKAGEAVQDVATKDLIDLNKLPKLNKERFTPEGVKKMVMDFEDKVKMADNRLGASESLKNVKDLLLKQKNVKDLLSKQKEKNIEKAFTTVKASLSPTKKDLETQFRDPITGNLRSQADIAAEGVFDAMIYSKKKIKNFEDLAKEVSKSKDIVGGSLEGIAKELDKVSDGISPAEVPSMKSLVAETKKGLKDEIDPEDEILKNKLTDIQTKIDSDQPVSFSEFLGVRRAFDKVHRLYTKQDFQRDGASAESFLKLRDVVNKSAYDKAMKLGVPEFKDINNKYRNISIAYNRIDSQRASAESKKLQQMMDPKIKKFLDGMKKVPIPGFGVTGQAIGNKLFDSLYSKADRVIEIEAQLPKIMKTLRKHNFTEDTLLKAKESIQKALDRMSEAQKQMRIEDAEKFFSKSFNETFEPPKVPSRFSKEQPRPRGPSNVTRGDNFQMFNKIPLLQSGIKRGENVVGEFDTDKATLSPEEFISKYGMDKKGNKVESLGGS